MITALEKFIEFTKKHIEEFNHAIEHFQKSKEKVENQEKVQP